jgi:hypothetical protein
MIAGPAVTVKHHLVLFRMENELGMISGAGVARRWPGGEAGRPDDGVFFFVRTRGRFTRDAEIAFLTPRSDRVD